MITQHRSLIVLLLASLLISACRADLGKPIARVAPTGSFVPVPTLEPTCTRTPTATVTSTRTLTSTPTLHWAEQIAQDFIHNVLEGTPGPGTSGITIYAPTQVMAPFPTAESLPTVPAQLADMDTSTLAFEDGLGWGQSPDGQWYWALDHQNSVPLPDSPVVIYALGVVRADGQARWHVRIEPSDVPEDNAYIDLFTYPVFFHPNEPYLYAAVVGCCGDPLSGPRLAMHQDLLRLNLDTGQVTQLVTGMLHHTYLFAPDGEYYLDAASGEAAVHVRSLTGEADKVIPLYKDYTQLGQGSFSPDGQYALFYARVPAPGQQNGQRFSLLRLDPRQGHHQVLFPNLDEVFGDWLLFPQMKWLDNTHLQLIDRSRDGLPELVLDILTGDVRGE